MAVFDAHKNLAISTVAVAPSPPTTGTSLTVPVGEGSRFATPPFNATVCDPSGPPTPLTAEVARVTAIAGDTLTLLRAQEGSTARLILVGDLIAETITAKALTDIESGTNFPLLATTGSISADGDISTGSDLFGREITASQTVHCQDLVAQGTIGAPDANLTNVDANTVSALVSVTAPLGQFGDLGTTPLDLAHLQFTASPRLLGRATSGAGGGEELLLGDGLVLDGTTLQATSRNSTLVNYSFSAVQIAPPGANQIRFDAGYPYTAVTRVWMWNVSADGQDVYLGLLAVAVGNTILVQDKNDHTQYGRFTVVAAPVDHTTYVEFPVVHVAHGNSIGGGQLVLAQNISGSSAPLTHHTTHEPGGSDAITALDASVLTTGTLASARLATQQKTRAITVVFGTGSAAITAGLKTYVSCPYTGTITAARLLAVDASVTSGSIVIDVWKDTYAAYPPVVGDSITASAKPTLSSATKSDDTTLTGWTTAVTAGDVFGFTVDSASLVTQIALQLTLVVS